MNNEQFEKLAEEFKFDTGFMAPGKDSPAIAYVSEEHEEQRQIAWKAWCKGRERGLNFI